MLFSSATFLFFFLPLSIVLHFLAGLFPKRGRITLQNLLLIGFSLVFFAWANVDAVRILLWLILLNYGIGLISLRFRKILLAGVILNILTLFYYKYPNTAMGWWSDLTSTTRTWDILVPLGISFIVFHNISYLLDIYRGKTQVNKNPIEVALYIVFFPKLIQGPIVKYYDMEGELKNRKTTLSDMSTGAERFIIGLAKKVLVADILAATTDDIFADVYRHRRSHCLARGIAVCVGHLYRFQRIFRYGHRPGALLRLSFSGEFSLSLFQSFCLRILAAMAHFTGILVSGIPVFSLRRKPKGKRLF